MQIMRSASEVMFFQTTPLMTYLAPAFSRLNATPHTKRLFRTLHTADMSVCSANDLIIVRLLPLKRTSYDVHGRIDTRF